MGHIPELGKPGPFEVKLNGAVTGATGAVSSKNSPPRTSIRLLEHSESEDLSVPTSEPPRRRYTCPNYEMCLDLAAALNWASFTCRGCNGDVDESLYWRAHQIRRKDSVAKILCVLPPLVAVKGTNDDGEDSTE
jgi:hypothetical protein